MRELIQKEMNVSGFFRELVMTAVESANVEITDMSEFYIVNLLSEFAKTEKLFDAVAGHYEEKPLAMMLVDALKSNRPERIKIYKKLGDVSLYIAGFFADHVDSKMVDVDYYVSMGEGAYRSLSGLLVGEKTFAELYDELANKFVDITDILSIVRSSAAFSSNVELLHLYERWLRTGDPKIRARLEKEGIATTVEDPRKNH